MQTLEQGHLGRKAYGMCGKQWWVLFDWNNRKMNRSCCSQIRKLNRVRTCSHNIRINISNIICEPMIGYQFILFAFPSPPLPFPNIWSDILRQVGRQISKKPWEEECHGFSINGKMSLASDLHKLSAHQIHLWISCQSLLQFPSA